MNSVLYMAPICGVTTYVYRNVYSHLFNGYDFAVTPFIKDGKVISSDNYLLRDLSVQRNKVHFELISQVLSKNVNDFIALSKVLFEMGYKTVNWNLGCPLKKVTRKTRGAGLLSVPDTIVKFLNEVIPAVPNQISIKARLGNKNSNELFELLPLLNDLPLKEIIIHPRTGNQMYKGEVDIAAFEKCLSVTKHSIVYNGDIDSLETFKYLSNRLPSINKWMIGRGGLTNPFLPEQIKGLICNTDQEKRERFMEFHDEMFSSYQNVLTDRIHVVAVMKLMWSYWSKAFKDGDKFLHLILRTRDMDQYVSEVNEFFSDEPELIV